MNQIEINKIVTTAYLNGREVKEEKWRVDKIYGTGVTLTKDSLYLDPSQMKELKEKIAKLDL